jgi:hypothetical protein
MTDTTNDITPEEAEAELARLEQDVIDGGDVTVTDLTAAKDRIGFARLMQKGREARAEKQREKEAADGRETAKAEVTALFEARKVDLDAYAIEATTALERYLEQLAGYNDFVVEAAEIMQRAGVVGPNRTLVNTLDEPGLDTSFFPTIEYGTVVAVRENRREHVVVHVGAEFRKLIHAVAEKHKLKTRGSADLAYKIGRD